MKHRLTWALLIVLLGLAGCNRAAPVTELKRLPVDDLDGVITKSGRTYRSQPLLARTQARTRASKQAWTSAVVSPTDRSVPRGSTSCRAASSSASRI